jgi:hypothetical protein
MTQSNDEAGPAHKRTRVDDVNGVCAPSTPAYIGDMLPDNAYLFVPPSRCVFKGALCALVCATYPVLKVHECAHASTVTTMMMMTT